MGDPGVANFAVTLVRGPRSDESVRIRIRIRIRDQRSWDEHAAFMDGLVDDGFGLLEIASVRPWALWLDFRARATGS